MRTNDGGEPTADPNRWVPCCFDNSAALGEKVLFVEFQFHFTEWQFDSNAVDEVTDCTGTSRHLGASILY